MSGNSVKVREAVSGDADVLIEFNVSMAKETEGKKLSRSKISPGVRNLFRKPGYGFYLVAEIDGRIAGSLMITYEWSDWRNGVFWWIQSVYVRPEFRRRGVYRALYEDVRSRARKSRDAVCGCRLYVEKENSVAQETYLKLGMEETYYKMFEEIF